MKRRLPTALNEKETAPSSLFISAMATPAEAAVPTPPRRRVPRWPPMPSPALLAGKPLRNVWRSDALAMLGSSTLRWTAERPSKTAWHQPMLIRTSSYGHKKLRQVEVRFHLLVAPTQSLDPAAPWISRRTVADCYRARYHQVEKNLPINCILAEKRDNDEFRPCADCR